MSCVVGVAMELDLKNREWQKKYDADPILYGNLKEFARKNRSHATDAESRMCSLLRDHALGVKFLRQFIIGPFIVDFVCLKSRLIIEVDGGYHSERTQQESDEDRTLYLQYKGFRVIRFSNEEVLYNIDQVKNRITIEL